MKKRFIFLCAAILLFAACTGEPQKPAEPVQTETAEEIVALPEPSPAETGPVDPDDYVGVYANGNTDFVVLEEIEDSYVMSVVLYRLIGLDGGTVSASEDR